MIEDTGYLNFTSFANDATVGSSAWVNVINAQTQNDINSEISVGGTTQYLKALQLSSLILPAPVQIVGIQVKIRKAGFFSTLSDHSVRLFVGGAVAGDDKKLAGNWPDSNLAIFEYGGSEDLWGLFLTPERVSAADFGVGVSGVFSDGSSCDVDHIAMKVFYDTSRMFATL
jgi:hypothetical protein